MLVKEPVNNTEYTCVYISSTNDDDVSSHPWPAYTVITGE